jgi:tetratricopeptide (TPR) repeat protein
VLVGLALVAPAVARGQAADAGKVPITTQSKEALTLYYEGRDLQEKLRATDAHGVLEKAVAKDSSFAMGHLLLANTAPSAKEFFASLEKAVALADKVSEGERHFILGLEAGVKSRPHEQEEHYKKLTAAFPNDERAFNLLGGLYFGQQRYDDALAAYAKAVAINPSFSQPYNQMGYAYRFQGRYDEAEKAFKKYIELIPRDPNPYDSYAELLMKMGRYDESIRNYEKALALDPHFVASYVGIGLNQVFQGEPEKARATLAKLEEKARNTGERRQALARTAQSHLYQGRYDKALEAVRAMYAIAEKEGDAAAMSGDANLMGDILLDAGRHDEALAEYARTVALMDRAQVPEDVKQATRRNALYDEARTALAKGDLATARAKSAAYAAQVAATNVRFEGWQSHYVAGLVALADKDHARALAELAQANPLDPQTPYALALVHRARGDGKAARDSCTKAAQDNSLNLNYAYVRSKARKLLASL